MSSIGSITLDGTQSSTLRVIRSEENGKNANLFSQPLPASDSNNTFVLDLFGTTRTINISGQVTGNKSDIQTFINSVETIVNGSQTAQTFTSSIHSATKSCLINSFRYNYSAGTPRILDYTLELIESAT